MDLHEAQEITRQAALELQRQEEQQHQERKGRDGIQKKKVEDDQYKIEDKVRRSQIPNPLAIEEQRLQKIRQFEACGIPPGF